MLFSQVASFFFFGLATTTLASPVAQPAVEALAIRADATPNVVFTSLKTTLDPLLSQITDLTSSGNVTAENIEPVLTQITNALNDAHTSLEAIPAGSLINLKRQSGDELADLVAGIVSDLVKALDGLVGDLSTIPILAGLLAGIDAALANVLHSLEGLLATVLILVATLLRNVAHLLSDLAFDLTLASLGF